MVHKNWFKYKTIGKKCSFLARSFPRSLARSLPLLPLVGLSNMASALTIIDIFKKKKFFLTCSKIAIL